MLGEASRAARAWRNRWSAGWVAGSPATALTQSCNPYFYESGYLLDQADPSLLPTYAETVGFGAPTGMEDLPEEAGNIQTPDWKRVTFGVDW